MTDVFTDFPSEELIKDKQQSLQAAKEAIAGPVPLIPEAPDPLLKLPRGLFLHGTFKTDVIVRELTGTDEEALAKMRESIDFFDLVVALGVERIDDFDLASMPVAERQGVLRQLLIGERDQIFVAIVKATFGEEKVLGFTCSVCQEEQEMTLLLSEDFKAKVIDDLDQQSYTMQTSKGAEIIYRLATGEDQREALAKKGASLAEQNSIVLSRCISQVNGGLVPDPLAYVRKLSIRDRQELLAGLVGRQPSVDMGVTTKCAACEAPQNLQLGFMDLFRS